MTVWGGFSTKWYGELLRNEQILNAAWLSIKVRRAFGDARRRARHARRHGARALRPLQGPHAAVGADHGAARDARGDHGPVAAAAVRDDGAADRLARRPRHDDDRDLAHHVHDGVRDGRRAVAPVADGRFARGSRDGPRRAAAQGLLPDHAADHLSGAAVGLAARVHALARRPRHHELRRGPGLEHAADGDLLEGAPRREPGHQRAGDDPRGRSSRSARSSPVS